MTINQPFTVYPALDLRSGDVVRLQRGDPGRQTTYSSDPLAVVREWLDQGIQWVHMVNLDGAFDEGRSLNYKKISQIAHLINTRGASVQLGGGLRSMDDIRAALDMGITRVILGTIAIEEPEVIEQAIEIFGPDRIAASLDAREGLIRTHGWLQGTPLTAIPFGERLYSSGVRWAVYTDISRDGMGSGVNLDAAVELAQATGLSVLAAGGVNDPSDIANAKEAGLSGVIVGRALYEGSVTIQDCLHFTG